MADVLRRILFFSGLLLILLLFSFTAYGFTTHGAIRSIVTDLAAQPEQAAGLQAQYQGMTQFFSSGAGDTYTYFFRSSPIVVTKTEVAGKSQDAVIGMILDKYANQFFNNNLTSGGPGEAGAIISATGNQIYGIVAMVTGLALGAILAWTFLGFRDVPVSYKLTTTGTALAAACVCAFIAFALVPVIIKTIAWSAIVESGADDVWNMVEPSAVGALLQNTFIAFVLAIALVVIGFLLARKGGTEKTPGVPGKK